MSEALKQFAREVLAEVLADASVEQKLQGVSPKDRLKGLSKDELRALVELAQRALADNSSPASK